MIQNGTATWEKQFGEVHQQKWWLKYLRNFLFHKKNAKTGNICYIHFSKLYKLQVTQMIAAIEETFI